MQPRRGHVGTDGLVFPPRHRRSARRNAEAEARERSKTLESEGGMPGAGLVGYGRMVWLGWVAVLGGFQYFGVARLGIFRFGVLRFYHWLNSNYNFTLIFELCDFTYIFLKWSHLTLGLHTINVSWILCLKNKINFLVDEDYIALHSFFPCCWSNYNLARPRLSKSWVNLSRGCWGEHTQPPPTLLSRPLASPLCHLH
jgi:hypothetical protein